VAHKEAYFTDDDGVGICGLARDRLNTIVLLDFKSMFWQYPNFDNFSGVVVVFSSYEALHDIYNGYIDESWKRERRFVELAVVDQWSSLSWMSPLIFHSRLRNVMLGIIRKQGPVVAI